MDHSFRKLYFKFRKHFPLEIDSQFQSLLSVCIFQRLQNTFSKLRYMHLLQFYIHSALRLVFLPTKRIFVIIVVVGKLIDIWNAELRVICITFCRMRTLHCSIFNLILDNSEMCAVKLFFSFWIVFFIHLPIYLCSRSIKLISIPIPITIWSLKCFIYEIHCFENSTQFELKWRRCFFKWVMHTMHLLFFHNNHTASTYYHWNCNFIKNL